jgi:hypothetical protein
MIVPDPGPWTPTETADDLDNDGRVTDSDTTCRRPLVDDARPGQCQWSLHVPQLSSALLSAATVTLWRSIGSLMPCGRVSVDFRDQPRGLCW